MEEGCRQSVPVTLHTQGERARVDSSMSVAPPPPPHVWQTQVLWWTLSHFPKETLKKNETNTSGMTKTEVATDRIAKSPNRTHRNGGNVRLLTADRRRVIIVSVRSFCSFCGMVCCCCCCCCCCLQFLQSHVQSKPTGYEAALLASSHQSSPPSPPPSTSIRYCPPLAG